MSFIKYFKKSLLIFVFLSMANNLYARTIDQVAESMGVSQNEAKAMLQATYALIKEIQNNISSIGSSSYEYEQKKGENGLINQTIKNYFSSSTSVVEVSSLNTKRTINYTIYNYLHRLANMSKDGVYRTVNIKFGKNIHFGQIYKENNEININADAWQLFEGCSYGSEGRRCYSDMTKKTFVVKIKDGVGFIDAIKVKETMNVNNTNVKLGN